MQRIITLIRTGLLATVAVLTAVSSQAATVEYYTEGLLYYGPTLTSSNLLIAPAPLTYIGVGDIEHPASADFNGFTFASLGALINRAGSEPVELNGTLRIDIFQVSPTDGTGSLFGTFSGTLQNTASTAIFTPTEGSTTIGAFNYSFVQPFYALVPITTLGGVTTLQGAIRESSAVPEPASVALLGGGLALFGFLSRRFRRSA